MPNSAQFFFGMPEVHPGRSRIALAPGMMRGPTIDNQLASALDCPLAEGSEPLQPGSTRGAAHRSESGSRSRFLDAGGLRRRTAQKEMVNR